MKNLIKRSICAVFCAVIVVGILSGCGSSKSKVAYEPTDTVLLWGGKRGNFPWVSSSVVYDDLMDTIQAGGTLTVIRIDGAPNVVSELKYEPLQSKSEQETKSRLLEVQDVIGECTAKESGLNTLKAMQLAAQQLEDSSNKKKLIIVDSGLCTEEPLNLTGMPLSNVDVKSTITSLRDSGEVANMADCNVIWYGLGVAFGEQEALTSKDKDTLKTLYEQYFSCAGAKLTWNSTSLGEDKLEDDVPSITPVPVTKSENGVVPVPDETVFPESKVAFQDASSKLLNTAAAEDALQDVITSLKANPDVEVYITGTTTNSDTAEHCRSLAKKRAQVVADILTKNGVKKKQLTVLGFGASGPNYKSDTHENQNAENRSVSIIRVDSDTGKKIASGTWQYD